MLHCYLHTFLGLSEAYVSKYVLERKILQAQIVEN